MKKISLLLVMAVIAVSSFAQSEAPEFKTIAIVPFHMLGYPDADNIDAVQSNIEDAFDQLQLPAQIMSAKQTAAAFSAKGINKNNIHSNTIEDLATILGVDAVVIGELNSASNGDVNMNEIVLQLIDGANGQIVWRAAKNVAMTESGANVKSVMTASAEKFPIGNN